MAKQKELTVKEQNPAVVYEMDAELAALLPRAETSDFDIPRLTMVQPTSKLDGNPGDVVDSTTNAKIVGAGEKLTFVPIWFFKDFAITEVASKKWRRNEAKVAGNAGLSLVENREGADHDGVIVRRSERLNLFVVQESSLSDDLPRLYRIVLKPSSFKEAKKFLSEWEIQLRSRLAPFTFIWSVTPKVISNDKGKFAIYDFQKELDGKAQRRVKPEHLEAVKFWVKTLAQNKAQVMKQDLPDEAEGDQPVQKDEIPF